METQLSNNITKFHNVILLLFLFVLRLHKKKKRVCAYGRVSTDDEEQITSYNSQIKYYTEKIKSDPDWEFVGIYADEGISGTQVKNRTEF